MGRAFEFRKARKMKRWSAMAKTFTRIGKDIVIAVKEGGPSPETNARLRAVIQNAKAANMPKAVSYTHLDVYKRQGKSFEPFKKLVKSRSKWLALIKDININPRPSNVTFRNDMNRVMNETQVRVVGEGDYKICLLYTSRCV